MSTAPAPSTQADRDTGQMVIMDPATGEQVGSLPIAGPEEAHRALAAARTAAADWAATSPAERGQLLHRAAQALEDAAEELAELNRRETGKPLQDSLGGVQAGAATLRQYAELGPVHRGHSLCGDQLATNYTVSEPRGVALLLTPWNDPVAVAAGLIGAALVTGNTVVHKPSERCPQVGARLGELLEPIFAPGVFSTVLGDAATGRVLSEAGQAQVIAHVGSSATGARLAEVAAATSAHLIRENGGNDPLLVDAGVDPQWAAEQAALGCFANAGQICTSVERIYVHRDIAAEFCRALTEQARQRNASGDFQPLVDAAHREGVHEQVRQALASGAVAAEGGMLPEGPGAHYPATVLLQCASGMRVMDEETFGPIAPVEVVDDFEQGLAKAHAGRYGLAASVLTADIAHLQQAVAGLPVGTVKVNAVFGGAPGGAAEPRGDSGAGFGYGPELLDEFTLTKVVHVSAPERRTP